MTAAYLMLLVDPRPERPAIAGVELYSGAHPAIMPLVGITVLSGEGATFEQGIADLRRQLRPRDDHDRHGWIVALLGPATRELLGRAAR